MPQTLDWGKLVSQGRAKAPGVSWSDEEVKALGIICKATGKTMSYVAQYIRKGILTIDAFNKAQEKPGVVNPFLKLSKEELMKKAQGLGLSASPDASKEVLAQTILEKKEKDIEKAKAEKKVEAEKDAKIREKTEAEVKAKAEADAKAKIEANKKKKEKKLVKKPVSKPKAKPTKKK